MPQAPTGPAPASSSAPTDYPRRFSWPMRLLIGLLLFDLVFRNLLTAVPWRDWAEKLDMRQRPRRLPTRAEMGQPGPEWRERAMESLDSTWEFFRPWPGAKTRAHLQSSAAAGKFLLCWASSRLAFLEALVGLEQEWPMFRTARTRVYLTRARMIYSDGTTQVVRSRPEPEDLTRFRRWNCEKIYDWELSIAPGEAYEDESFGYCNYLMHRHALGPNGQALKAIRLYQVRVNYPPPGVDARAFLQVQMERIKEGGPNVLPDFYQFDVATRRGRCLD